jgi:hypothetical protein
MLNICSKEKNINILDNFPTIATIFWTVIIQYYWSKSILVAFLNLILSFIFMYFINF